MWNHKKKLCVCSLWIRLGKFYLKRLEGEKNHRDERSIISFATPMFIFMLYVFIADDNQRVGVCN